MLINVRGAEEQMPPGISVLETEDVVLVRCRWCGWERAFYCGRFTLHAGQVVALTHRVGCPGSHARG